MSGAAHLVHGMGLALEAPAWPAIMTDEAAAVLAQFPAAGRLIALDWHSPRPFSAAALVQSDAGTLFLKRHHRSLRSPAALAEEHGYMAHLRAAGLAVPDMLRTADGAGAVALGEWSYELHRQAAGIDLYRDRQSWTPFLSHDHAHAAGVALAQLHRASAGYAAPARGPHPLVSSFTILPDADPLAAADAYIAARPAVAAFLADLPWRTELARLFAALGEGLAEWLADQPALWTHNDWHPSNLLWTPDGRVHDLFDFGLSTRTCALHDLATAIERTAIPWLTLEAGRLTAPADPEAALALLAGYATILPFDRADVETLIRLLPLVHVEFALTEIDYFAGILGDRDGAMLAWQAYLIGHADWFLSMQGQDFMARLAQGAVA